MLSLVNFFEFGIEWIGEPAAVMLVTQRRAAIVLARLAHLTNARNPNVGVTTGKFTLGGKSYSDRNVARALADLQKLGIIKRTRNLTARRAGGREGFATTSINERLIKAAEAWADVCASAKKDKSAKPSKTKIAIPLISTAPPANPSPEPVPEGRGDKLALLGMTNCHTQTITPPGTLVEGAEGVMHLASEKNKLAPSIFGSAEEILEFGEKRKNRDHAFRRMTSWMRACNQRDDLVAIGLLPSKPADGQGWFELFTKINPVTGNVSKTGLAFVKPEQLFGVANGKKQGVYVRPRDGSRLVLVDDLATHEPLFQAPHVILETSKKNYQHIYCVDRPLSNQERNLMQKELANRFGGDLGATSGAQPHRVPGSINYKPGRRNFWTKLILLELAGEPIKADEFLLNSVPSPPAFTHKPAKNQRLLSKKEQSESDKDFLDCLSKLSAGEELQKILDWLTIKSIARGKHSGYPKMTLDKAFSLFSRG